MEQRTAAAETGGPSELASQVGVERLFAPQSVAVVGASEQGPGRMVFANLRRDFPGTLYPVNPRRPEVLGVKAYPTVDDLPEAVDMAVLLVPAAHVPDIAERCAARGIGGALVLAAGFAEAGPEGLAAQQRLTDLARTSAFPIIGPNCNGFMNGHRKTLATFAIPPDSDRPTPGPVALISQSGGFGAYIMEKPWARWPATRRCCAPASVPRRRRRTPTGWTGSEPCWLRTAPGPSSWNQWPSRCWPSTASRSAGRWWPARPPRRWPPPSSSAGRVALKALSYRLPHKSDSGALRLGLAGETSVRRGYEDLVRDISAAFPGLTIEGILVQEMVPASVEISCGLQRDPVFGPMVAVGLGGTLIEIVGGAVLLRAPFTHRMAREAVDLICAGRLRQASRGLSQAQAEIIAGVLTGVGELALELPEVESVDINPIRVHGDVVRAVDALIVVAGGPAESADAVAAGAAST